MDKDHRINQFEEPDMNGVFTDDTPDVIYSDGSISFFKNKEDCAWERSLFAPILYSTDLLASDPGIALSDRKEQKEARELLWKQDFFLPTVIPAAPLPGTDLAQADGSEETAGGTNPVQGAVSRDSSAGRIGYAAGRRSAGKPNYAAGRRNAGETSYAAGRKKNRISNPHGQTALCKWTTPGGQNTRHTRNVSSRASARSSIHDRAWEILTDNEPAQNSRRSMRANPQKISKRGLAFIVLLTFLISILIVISTFLFISHISSNVDNRGTIGSDIFIGGVCKPTPEVDFCLGCKPTPEVDFKV